MPVVRIKPAPAQQAVANPPRNVGVVFLVDGLLSLVKAVESARQKWARYHNSSTLVLWQRCCGSNSSSCV